MSFPPCDSSKISKTYGPVCFSLETARKTTAGRVYPTSQLTWGQRWQGGSREDMESIGPAHKRRQAGGSSLSSGRSRGISYHCSTVLFTDFLFPILPPPQSGGKKKMEGSTNRTLLFLFNGIFFFNWLKFTFSRILFRELKESDL